MIQKLLYSFVAQETFALIEKINATDSTVDSSFQSAEHLLRHGKFNFVERRLLAGAIKKVARRETLVGAMNVVVYNNVEGEIRSTGRSKYSTQIGNAPVNSILSASAQDAWQRQLNAVSLQNTTASEYANILQGQMSAQQAGMYGQQYGIR
jgi:hypothetical protein